MHKKRPPKSGYRRTKINCKRFFYLCSFGCLFGTFHNLWCWQKPPVHWHLYLFIAFCCMTFWIEDMVQLFSFISLNLKGNIFFFFLRTIPIYNLHDSNHMRDLSLGLMVEERFLRLFKFCRITWDQLIAFSHNPCILSHDIGSMLFSVLVSLPANCCEICNWYCEIYLQLIYVVYVKFSVFMRMIDMTCFCCLIDTEELFPDFFYFSIQCSFCMGDQKFEYILILKCCQMPCDTNARDKHQGLV